MNRITSIGEILFDIYPDKKTPGGAPFNFIYHIINLTGNGNFVSRIGNDREGNEIIKFLKKYNISANFIQIDSGHPTGESIAVLDALKIPSWEIKIDTAYDFIELDDELELLVKEQTECLYFGTLAQRDPTTKNTIQHFFNRNIKYFCDLNIRQYFYTKELIEECLKACNILKLNAEELHLVNKLLFNINSDTDEVSKRLISEYNIEQLCVTFGEQGAVIYQGSRKNHYKATVGKVIDTVGAGDAYAAVFCIGYLNHWDMEKTNRIASEFAAEIVQISGALPSDPAFYKKYKELVNE